MVNAPTVLAQLEPGTRRLPMAKGKVIGCYGVPVKLLGIGEIRFETPVYLSAGETLEYWMVEEGGRQFYRTKLHPLDCRCGGACSS